MDTLDIKIKELEGRLLFYRPSGYNSVYMVDLLTGENKGIIIVTDPDRFCGKKLSAAFDRDGICKGVREVVKNHYKTKEDLLLAINKVLDRDLVRWNRSALVQFTKDVEQLDTW